MKIAHVSATFPPYQAGTGNVCYQNARGLALRGHDVHVFTGAGAGAPQLEHEAGVTIHRLRPWFRIGNAPFAPGLILDLSGFEVIHLHYPFIFGDYLVHLAAASRQTPLILTFHNDLIGDGLRARVLAAYMALSVLLVVRRAAALCAVSMDHFGASRLHQTLGSKHPPVYELPNTVDGDLFRPGNGTDVRQRHAIPPEAPLILCVAALDRAHHFKGVSLLLEVFGTLDGETWLLVVGDGDLRMQYEQQARQSGAGRRVVFAGAIANNDLAPYYQCADVTVLPSSPPESFGIVLVESMACATPVIASDIPGVRTVVDHEVDGLLCRPADADRLRNAFQAFLALPSETRRAMGRRGREKVLARYGPTANADRLQAIYEQVLAR